MDRLATRLGASSRLGALVLASVVLICLGSVVALATARSTEPGGPWRSIAIGLLAGFPGILFIGIAIRRGEERARQERSQKALALRANSVDRLLEFSQAVQAAGKADQVFPTLAHYLQNELGLSAVAILAHDADAIPATQLMLSRPESLISKNPPIAEMETRMCPCLRQNLPRQFQCDGSPVRCSIDAHLTLPATHPAYCIPIRVSPKTQVVVHMLLPITEEWSESRRQLAQTYANTAQSALITLQLLSEAEQRSMTDGLTGLYNRRSMESLMTREVALAERHKRPLSMVMIDLDLFKAINDAHGHAAGDHLLRAFADCLRMTLRKTDLAFRYGGDEFAIALPQTSVDQAEQVVAKLRQAFASVDFSSAITHLDQQPTLSIGVAERSEAHNVLTLSSLMTAADQALYEAKSASRNCVRIYSPPRAA